MVIEEVSVVVAEVVALLHDAVINDSATKPVNNARRQLILVGNRFFIPIPIDVVYY